MKILIIGNSHIAALKTGWDRLNGLLADKLEPTFAGAQGKGLSQFKRHGTVFRPEADFQRNELRFTSGGLNQIDVSEFGVIVTAGLYFGRYRLLENLSRHRTEGHLPNKMPRYLVSEEVERLSLENAVQHSFCVQFVKRLRMATDSPILALEQPMPRQSALTESNRKWQWRFAARLKASINNVWARETEKLNRDLNIEVLNQPEETLTNDNLTSDEFGTGSARMLEGFDEKHRNNEYLHMNAAYGEIVLKHIAERLRNRL